MTMSAPARGRPKQTSLRPIGSRDLDKLAPFDSIAQLLKAQAKLATIYTEEISRFANQRLRRDEQFLTELTSSRDWESVVLLQARWAAETLTDYMQESGQWADLLQKLPSEMLAAQPGAEMKAAA